MKIAIASDHAGFTLKEKLIKYLTKKYEIKDFGCDSEESVDYPDFVHPLSKAISNNDYDMGIAICGTGNGVTITVNKHEEIRGALCWNDIIAWLSRKHNNANICCLPAWYITDMEAYKIVDTFIETNFEGGRHQRRIDKMKK